MDITNKTLVIMLIAAILVSIAGTFINVTRMGDASTTGYQLLNVSSVVELDILSSLSITTDDSSTIDFGICNLGENSQGITINSDISGAGANTDSDCLGFIATPIAIRNNGNIDALVTFNISDVGTAQNGSFLDTGSSNSSIAFKLLNEGFVDFAGCAGILGSGSDNSSMVAYQIFQNTSEYNACTNLTAGLANTILSHFEIVIPDDTVTGDNLTVTYFASEAG